MKFAYRNPTAFKKKSIKLLAQFLAVIDEYKQQGYILTLRQLHYQLVGRGIYLNTKSNYKKLCYLLGEARMCGLCDWDAIEDRLRIPHLPNEFEDVSDGVHLLMQVFRRKRWIDQENYVEVWVEKDALSGVLRPITDEYHVRLLVNRGYSSISAMHDAALRFQEATDAGKKCYLIYIGDFDPSGEDMVRDIIERLIEFGADVEVTKIALTKEQVKQYDLPPNFAKTTDTRARGFIEANGTKSWEVDALPPAVLNELLQDALDALLDREAYERWIKVEEYDKSDMTAFADSHVDPQTNSEDALQETLDRHRSEEESS